MSSNGMFVWNELATPEPEAAREFYKSLLGWDCQREDSPGGEYWIFKSDGADRGGLMPMEGEEWQGIPPHWMSYIQVDDLQRSVGEAKKHGGTVEVEPMEIPDMGEFSMITDPTGATFSLISFDEPGESNYGYEHGRFCWNELYTDDPETAKEFYSAVVGWDFRTWEDDEYILASTPEGDAAGIMDTSSPEFETSPPPHWGSYISVDDVDATSVRAEQLGGELMHGPADIPEVGRFSVLRDPTGAVIYLMTFAESDKEDPTEREKVRDA